MTKKDHIQKTQAIRVVDVAVIGPVMIYAGAVKSSLPQWTKFALVGFGIATIIFNFDNYLKNK